MSITTIKHCQSDPDYWYTVEDRDRECDDDMEVLIVTYYEADKPEGDRRLSLFKDDALLIRDAINQLYPVD